ncbi:hypothetical protein KW794_03490, partial [Candidatus Saccharibacteria bacterium]|nr:hypothetical protein [Candidatus Saccharibacteria bacterium]
GEQRLKNLLVSQYKASDSSLHIHGNYASAGATCAAEGTVEKPTSAFEGGFQAWLKKANNAWTVAFKGQQAPVCNDFDGQGWPSDVMTCLDEDSGTTRAPKP